MATLANSIGFPDSSLLAIGRTSRMRETIIIVKEINPLMDPYIHHGYETDMSVKRNIDQLMLIGAFPIGV